MKSAVIVLLTASLFGILTFLYLEPTKAQEKSRLNTPTLDLDGDGGIKPVPRMIEESRANGALFERRSLFQNDARPIDGNSDLTSTVAEGSVFSLDRAAVALISSEKPAFLTLPINNGKGGIIELELAKVDILAPGFYVETSDGSNKSYKNSYGVHYRGIIRGDTRSLASISIFKNEVMGVFSTKGTGNFVVGRLSGANENDTHIFYEDTDLKARPDTFCNVKTPDGVTLPKAPEPMDDAALIRCVRMYVETNFNVFQNKGSVANVTSFVTGFFNQSATLMANAGVAVSLSQVFVWTSASPYTGNTSTAQLDSFKATRTTFNGNLAHLVDLQNIGGLAYLDVNCVPSFAYAYSGIFDSFNNVPTYSWTVNVFAHETGHNLGSPHTQACAWNGNNTAIDGCAPVEGGTCALPPIPGSGGTIMSYCHLQSVGVNLALGYGPQPSSLILSRFNASTCLNDCGGAPLAPVAGSPTNLTSTSFTANWATSGGATGYRLDVSTSSTFATFVTGFNNLDVGNILSQSVTGLSPSTTYFYRVRAYNASGTSGNSSTITVTTFAGAPAPPTATIASAITTNSFIANWGISSGATGYRLDVSTSNAFGTFVTGFNNLDVGNVTNRSVTGLSSNTQYFYRVRAYNGTGTSGNSNTVTATTTGTCSYSLNPTSQNFSSAAGSNSVQVTTQAGCSWTAVSNSFAEIFAPFDAGSLPSDKLFRGPSTPSTAALTPAFSEGFENIATLTASGWFLQNNSVPLGTTSWFQGNTAVFPAQAGTAPSYIGGNFNATTGTNTISLWLLTPTVDFNNGDVIRFYTRSIAGNPFPDRLQVRLSTSGASTNIGTGPTGIGAFTTLLTDINPTYTVGGYPEVWTQYTITISGLSGQTSGRLAFRYFVENGGPAGDNSNYIGIDTFSYTPTTSAGWITINSGSSGTGSGTVNYSVTQNSTGSQRAGTMTIAGQTFNVTQAAPGVTPTRKPADFDGDGRTDLSIFRPSNGQWWVNRSSNGSSFATAFGISTDRLAPSDFTGDGRTDHAFFRPSTGEWFILRSENFTFFAFPYGTNGDIPSPGDYDGDGRADAAVFRPSTVTWYIRRSTDGGSTIQTFGAAGDRPVNADYDGDGRSDLAIFRPASGQWWIQRSSNSSVVAYIFGNSADRNVPGDYSGDGRADVAIWRPSTGEWFILRSENLSFYAFPWGISTDIASPGDYDGDGRFDAAVFRPSTSTWYVDRTSLPASPLIQAFGAAGDMSVPNAFVR